MKYKPLATRVQKRFSMWVQTFATNSEKSWNIQVQSQHGSHMCEKLKLGGRICNRTPPTVCSHRSLQMSSHGSMFLVPPCSQCNHTDSVLLEERSPCGSRTPHLVIHASCMLNGFNLLLPLARLQEKLHHWSLNSNEQNIISNWHCHHLLLYGSTEQSDILNGGRPLWLSSVEQIFCRTLRFKQLTVFLYMQNKQTNKKTNTKMKA